MKIKVFIERTNKNLIVDIKENSTILDLLKQLQINKTTVLTAKNHTLVTEDTLLKNKDSIQILSVISGG